MNTIKANIVTKEEIFEGEVHFDEKIQKITKINSTPNDNLGFLIPGFVDLHIHGGGGNDVMDKAPLDNILKAHAQNGTTSLLLTTVTSNKKDLEETFQKIESHKSTKHKGESKILGIHLEGPYINPKKLGAQPEFTRYFDADEIQALNQISPIKITTIAPEIFKSSDLKKLLALKILIQIGHSNATYEETVSALDNGAKSFTHLFNAMSAFHHREPGVAGAALAHANYAEIIPDLLHVHPGAIKAALRSIPKLYFVTDATSATGMPDGNYMLGTHHVSKCANGVRLSDGTLAGSALTMHQALINLTADKIGLSLIEASYRLSYLPCELLGIENERGQIKTNQFADLILMDRDFQIKQVYIEGELV